jgi:hypothetical protein
MEGKLGNSRWVDEDKRVVEHIPTDARFWVYPYVHVVEGTWVAGARTPWGREYVLEEIVADVGRFLEVARAA